jgi:outer membrane protein assembly factor BamE (lipoprotein component of BamABCDE complex)
MLFYNPSKLLIYFCLVVLLAACAPKIDIRGNLLDLELLSEITPGDHSREEVQEILGTPSTITMFDQETWLYIFERTETIAFFEPVVIERKVSILNFNKEGVVSKVETLNAENGKKIQPIVRTTATSGKKLDFFEQIFGNLGRFNAPEIDPQR